MDIGKYWVTFFVVVAIVALLAASPALSRVLVYPRTEFFTEMYILGSNHTAEGYPYNVSSGKSYAVFLGIGNQLGYCAYYLVEVKFRNESQSRPSSFGPVENRTPSDLPSLINVTAFVADQHDWESSLTFSFGFVLNQTLGRADFYSMTFNDSFINLDGYATTWNSTRGVYSGNLFFELWLYDLSTGGFRYHGRSIGLQLNMTDA